MPHPLHGADTGVNWWHRRPCLCMPHPLHRRGYRGGFRALALDSSACVNDDAALHRSAATPHAPASLQQHNARQTGWTCRARTTVTATHPEGCDYIDAQVPQPSSILSPATSIQSASPARYQTILTAGMSHPPNGSSQYRVRSPQQPGRTDRTDGQQRAETRPSRSGKRYRPQSKREAFRLHFSYYQSVGMRATNSVK